MTTRTERRNATRRKTYAREPGPRHLAVPPTKGHTAADSEHRPYDALGVRRPSGGPGQAVMGRSHCRCGAMSPELWTNRERRLWHTEHREQIAGVAWK